LGGSSFIAAEPRSVNELSAPMKAMVKTITLRSALIGLLLTAGLMGCTDPKSNPVKPPPPDREGVTLNMNSDHISPDASGKPYIVQSDWMIGAGRTVTIDPGTEIMFSGQYWVDVQGQLVARGTESQPILFTSSRQLPDYGQWRGFKLRERAPGDAQSEFSHCVFAYGGYIESDTTKRDNVDTTLFLARAFAGLLCVRNSSPTIEHCVAVLNGNNAIYISGASSRPVIKYNVFTRNDASAIRGDTTLGDLSQLSGLIAYNNVADNSSKPFLFLSNDSLYGKKVQRNLNLDSCDQFFNLIDFELSPKFFYQSADRYAKPSVWSPQGLDFELESCSPCVDAGPSGVDLDGDGTRADMGTLPYVHGPGELRGVVSGTLEAGMPYRMSCDVKVDSNSVLTIPAGIRISVTGYYRLDVEGQLIINGTPESHVTFILQPGDTTIVNADIWAGIRFSNQYPDVAASIIHYADFDKTQHTLVQKPRVEFVGCSFTRAYETGLVISTGSINLADSVSVRNCTFETCGAIGIEADTCSVMIRNTQVLGTPGRGISLNGTGEAAAVTNTIVRNSGGIGLALLHGSHPQIVNNTIAMNGYHGIYMEDNCRPNMLNNIITRNGIYGVWDSLSSFPTADYSNVWGQYRISGRDTTRYDYHGQHWQAGENSISADPLFVSSTDLHLQAGSPCINTGDPQPEYNDTDGSRNDMGAYGGPAGGNVGARAHSGLRSRLASK
jgi:parallel beta-helix repeat protein